MAKQKPKSLKSRLKDPKFTSLLILIVAGIAIVIVVIILNFFYHTPYYPNDVCSSGISNKSPFCSGSGQVQNEPQ